MTIFIDCNLISQRYEISECDITNNQCKLNINNVYSSFECPNSNLTRFYWKTVTLSDKDIITFINATTHNNNNYIIPDYIRDINIRDSSNFSENCIVPNYAPFSWKPLCEDIRIQFNDDWTYLVSLIVTLLLGTIWLLIFFNINDNFDRCVVPYVELHYYH